MKNEDFIINDTITSLDNKIKDIISVDKLYNIKEFFNDDIENNDYIFEKMINEYLFKISKLNHEYVLNILFSKDQKVSIRQNINNIIDFFYIDEYNQIDEEACEIAHKLISKVLVNNEQNIELPIKIPDIKKYFISADIKKNNLNALFMWIILYFSAIYNYLDTLKIEKEF